MTGIQNSKLPSLVFAEASVHSVGGVSMFETQEPITSENVQQFYNQPDLTDQAVKQLQEQGFTVLQVGATSISIAAAPDVYERVFMTNVVSKEIPVFKFGKEDTATLLDSTNTPAEQFGLIDTKNSPLANVLEGVALSTPMYPMSRVVAETDIDERHFVANVPSATPPEGRGHYLQLQDVARLLRAPEIHRNGYTGRGVNVVMTDSGWYNHPYFQENNVNANPVILSEFTTNPAHDESGHGTGESANIFAVAPDVTFTMIKTNLGSELTQVYVSAASAFKRAIELAPDIITNSWGFDYREGHAPSFFRAMSAAVADAVSRGIVVVFSAGNGHIGFPGDHPDVISAGGVYVDEDGTMQASNYSSGYPSFMYGRARIVPDVSGLVGMQPRAQYIMLPVEPGDELDRYEAASDQGARGDGTRPNDGWALFSGTSAAAPQIAGICALIKQVNPALSPRQVRSILQETAQDVMRGVSHQGNPAHRGVDVATGAGLANAERAVRAAQQLH